MATDQNVWELARIAEGQQNLIDQLITVASHFLAGEKMETKAHTVAEWLSNASALRLSIKRVQERVGDRRQ